MAIAVIPARGGSKRIHRKNIKSFCGKPIIAYTISAALESECFERIIVSTDDLEIAEIAREYGAEVPFLRDKELADDHTGTTPVIQHTISWLQKNDSHSAPKYVCCLYATAPFLTPAFIKSGIEQLLSNDIDFSFSLTSFPFPIQRALRMDAGGRVSMFQPSNYASRSQDLEPAFHDAGQFYWGKTESWLSGKPMFTSDSKGVVIPRHLVQDIDTSEDWVRAEVMYNTLQNMQS